MTSKTWVKNSDRSENNAFQWPRDNRRKNTRINACHKCPRMTNNDDEWCSRKYQSQMCTSMRYDSTSNWTRVSRIATRLSNGRFTNDWNDGRLLSVERTNERTASMFLCVAEGWNERRDVIEERLNNWSAWKNGSINRSKEWIARSDWKKGSMDEMNRSDE